MAAIFAVGMLGLLSLSVYWRSSDQKKLEQVASTTHEALCTFTADLQRRHDDGVAFLKKHPKGIVDISAAEIRRSLKNQQATLDALSGLDCN